MFVGFHEHRARGQFWKPFGLHVETIVGAFGLQMEVMFDPGGICLRIVRLSKIGSKSCDFRNVPGLSQASPGYTIQDFHCVNIRELEQEL